MKALIHDKEHIRLAHEINEREERIEALRDLAIKKANEATSEQLLQGQALIAAKAKIPNSLWPDWRRGHIPNTDRVANQYMSLAKNPGRLSNLDEAGAFRIQLQLFPKEAPTHKQPTGWSHLPYMDAINRLSRLLSYIERNPVDQWPSEGLESFREKLEPIAAKLWPERFV